MFRNVITVICLVLMLGVTASWVRSLAASEAYIWRLDRESTIIARHAQGAFTVACHQAGIVLSMPHWVALTLLAVWPVFHLRVNLDDRKLVPRKK